MTAPKTPPSPAPHWSGVSARMLVLCLVAIATAVAVYMAAYRVFLSAEQSAANGRLSLYRSTVVAELERFSHLPFVLARDAAVIAAAEGGPPGALDTRLAVFAEQAGLDAIFLMTPEGLTISASNAQSPASFVGQNYGFRPYFRDAAAGGQGRFYGIGATTGLPGYFIANPVVGEDGALLGVIAIKLDLIRLENTWRDAGETVFLVNDDGVVLLASEPAWRYRALSALDQTQRDRIAATRQFIGQDLAPLDWEPMADNWATIEGYPQIHLTAHDLPEGWVLHYFASDAPAVTRAWLAAGLSVILAAAMLILLQLRRNTQISASLRRSEAEEALLRETNERLAVEIEERRAAERRLERAQGELARTSRLAALGELAASVTHELGQPITAMRNHVAAAEMSGQNAGFVGRLAGLLERMEGITRQLKFFSAPGDHALTDLDLRQAMDEAVALVLPDPAALEVSVNPTMPDHPVIVHGKKLRLEQVMINLLRNALDAMEECVEREIGIEIGQSDSAAWFEIRDRGHGLGGATLTDLQEPFVTSRASGEGMGLGLAISAGIVKEHEGRMQAHDHPEGGAIFRVDLPRPQVQPQEVAAE